ncbi:hypothetical protein N7486_011090 [Penicillium sp. IBT 16267x]|nr:hypothetical protein N7486_011090 [Penicillium sp. IBT 16267x]
MSSSSPETDSEERQRNRDIIWAIWRKIEACKSTFLSPSDLQAFGVEAYQVDISKNETLQFEPCFFKPHPVGVFQKYPIDVTSQSYDPHRIEYVPTLQDALDTIQNRPPATEDPLEAAQELLQKMLEDYYSRDVYSHVESINCHFPYIFASDREGGPPGLPFFRLNQIGDVSTWVCDINLSLGLTDAGTLNWFRQKNSVIWKHELFLEDRDKTSPLPHASCFIIAAVDATLADQDLTLHEMRAIMIRSRGSRRKWPIYPILLISLMGKQHGRITQVIFEKGRIVLQYSKLWSFEFEDTAPIELFTRYMMS